MPETKYFRAIYAACKSHAIDNDMLHEIVLDRFEKTSLRDLNDAQCRRLLDGLNGRSFGFGRSGHAGTARGAAMQSAGRRGPGVQMPEYLVNDRERRMLSELAARRGWNQETLQTFVHRQLRGEDLTTIKQFNKILWALKSMNRRDGIPAEKSA